MNPKQILDRVSELRNLIIQEAENRKEELHEESQAQANERRNKLFGEMREKLITEFAKKEEANDTEIKTQRSRTINKSRLEVQEQRQSLLSQLREDTKAKIIVQI
jgi:ATP synthase (E/31 kDa) subunit